MENTSSINESKNALMERADSLLRWQRPCRTVSLLTVAEAITEGRGLRPLPGAAAAKNAELPIQSLSTLLNEKNSNVSPTYIANLLNSMLPMCAPSTSQ
jgi:hypothetical protein